MAGHELHVADERLLAVAKAGVGPLQRLGVDPLRPPPLADARAALAQAAVGVAGSDELLHGPLDLAGGQARQVWVGLHGPEGARRGRAAAEGRPGSRLSA